MRRCTHLSFTIQCMAIISLFILKTHSIPLPIIPDEENEGKLGMVDIASMSKEAILGKMVLPDDTQQAKDTKSVIAQYIFSLAQQESLKTTTGAPSGSEIIPENTLTETDWPETATIKVTTEKPRTTPLPTTTEEPEYEEEIVERKPSREQEATDAIQDIINAAIFQAQEEAPTTTTTTPPPTTMRRRRTRSTTMRARRTTTDISDYYDEDTEAATTIRRRTYRPTRRTTRNPDSGATGWVPEVDDEEHEYTTPTPASANTVNVLNDITKLIVNVGNADVGGIVDQSLKIASVETVGSVISGVFNLFMCTPLDQLVGRCKQGKGGKINYP